MANRGKIKATLLIIAIGLLLRITVLSVPEKTLALQDEHWGEHWGDLPYIGTNSPVSQPFVYQNSTIDVSLYFGQPRNSTQFSSFYYSINQTGNHALNCLKQTDDYYCNYSLSTTLENLANGNYTLHVSADYVNGTNGSIWDTNFTIDTTFPTPVVTIISPINQTYHTNTIEVAYNVDSKVIMAYYSVDSPDSRPLYYTSFNGSKSVTLSDLPDGNYKVSFWVRTEAGEHVYLNELHAPIETVYFTVDTAPPYTAIAIIITVAVTAGLVALLSVMWLKRRNKPSSADAALASF